MIDKKGLFKLLLDTFPKFQYLLQLVKHKYYVYIYGRQLGLGKIQLLLHDLSKFMPIEFIPYADQFYGTKRNPKFMEAWLHHQNVNKHHWEYWIRRHLRKTNLKMWVAEEMPDKYIKELIADWLAASKVYEGVYPEKHKWQYINDNFEKMVFHPKTRIKILEMLYELDLIDLDENYKIVIPEEKPIEEEPPKFTPKKTRRRKKTKTDSSQNE